MKKIILIIVLAFAACTMPVEEKGAGFFKNDAEEKYVVSTDDITDIWIKYIEAHNNRDIEAIMSMETDSISITAPGGIKVSGKEMHKEVLSGWLEAEQPKWDIYWAMPYKAVKKDQDWVIAGHWVTTNIDGEEKTEAHMIDARIVDGLVDLFYVYSLEASEESDSE